MRDWMIFAAAMAVGMVLALGTVYLVIRAGTRPPDGVSFLVGAVWSFVTTQVAIRRFHLFGSV